MPCSADFYIIDNEIFPKEKFNISFLEKGISIYEVVKITNSLPLFFNEHLQRLHKSAKIEGLLIPISDQDIKKQVLKLIKINNIKKGRLKFAIRFHSSGNKLICFYLKNIKPETKVYKTGIKIISEKIERINPNSKVINYKLREFVKNKTKTENVFETLLISKSGKITECSKSNIFFIKENKVFTPKSKDILKGITRDYIFKICKTNNIEIFEKDIFLKEISEFEAVFITGTSIGVLTVNQIDNTLFSKNNKTLKNISDEYFNIIKDYKKNNFH